MSNDIINKDIKSRKIYKIAKSRVIRANDIVKTISQGGNYMMVQKSPNGLGGNYIIPFDKEFYIVKSTGEVKAFSRNKNKQNDNLRKTFKRLSGLIRTNFESQAKNQLFITLTYKENMTDTKRLYDDFKKFYKKLNYYYPKYKFEYISVAEPQERGAWHFHLMLKATNRKNLFIDCGKIEQMWGHGACSTARLEVADDLGAYYIAYFTNTIDTFGVVDKATDTFDKSNSVVDKSIKRAIKGGRMHMYPAGFNFYRCSRGLNKPEVVHERYSEAIQKVNDKGLTQAYAVTYEIECGDGANKPIEIIQQIYKKK